MTRSRRPRRSDSPARNRAAPGGLPALLLGVLIGAALIVLWHPGERGGFWQGIEGRLLDARFALRGPRAPSGGVMVVAFDDVAVAGLDAFPPTRRDLADVVDQVFDAGARAVALDFLLVDARADDGLLAAALARGPAVLAVAEAPAGTPPPALDNPGGFALFVGPPPGAALPALAPTAGLQGRVHLGHVTVGTGTGSRGPDGALRRLRPALALITDSGPIWLPGLAVAAVAAGQDSADAPRMQVPAAGIGGQLEVGGRRLPLDLRGALPLNYYGPEGTIPTLSAAALSGADLRGQIVFLGATATGFGDRQATSFDATLPGVEAHATLAANLMDEQTLRRDGAAWLASAVLALIAAGAGAVAGGLRRPMAAFLATGTTACVVGGALQAAFVTGWWLDATTVLLALGLGAVSGAARRSLDHRRRAANLARYQSPALVETLAAHAEPMRGLPQPAVVLFVDVAGFTARAERLGPESTATFLRRFHAMVEAAAEPQGGLIMDFAGDGALVVFGLPEGSRDDAAQALRFVEAVVAAARRDGLALRVGGHAGPVLFGVVGGARHRAVSVSGDVVNTASRLQEFAKAQGASLALSEDFVARGASVRSWVTGAGLRCLTDQHLRGRARALDIWVGDPPGPCAPTGTDGIGMDAG